jgi:hypothetical protein
MNKLYIIRENNINYQTCKEVKLGCFSHHLVKNNPDPLWIILFSPPNATNEALKKQKGRA